MSSATAAFPAGADLELVYVVGLRCPSPAIVPVDNAHADGPPVRGILQSRVRARHRLKIGDRSKSFAELMRDYPPPEIAE